MNEQLEELMHDLYMDWGFEKGMTPEQFVKSMGLDTWAQRTFDHYVELSWFRKKLGLKEFQDGIMRGIEDSKADRVKPWSGVKKEFKIVQVEGDEWGKMLDKKLEITNE